MDDQRPPPTQEECNETLNKLKEATIAALVAFNIVIDLFLVAIGQQQRLGAYRVPQLAAWVLSLLRQSDATLPEVDPEAAAPQREKLLQLFIVRLQAVLIETRNLINLFLVLIRNTAIQGHHLPIVLNFIASILPAPAFATLVFPPAPIDASTVVSTATARPKKRTTMRDSGKVKGGSRRRHGKETDENDSDTPREIDGEEEVDSYYSLDNTSEDEDEQTSKASKKSSTTAAHGDNSVATSKQSSSASPSRDPLADTFSPPKRPERNSRRTRLDYVALAGLSEDDLPSESDA